MAKQRQVTAYVLDPEHHTQADQTFPGVLPGVFAADTPVAAWAFGDLRVSDIDAVIAETGIPLVKVRVPESRFKDEAPDEYDEELETQQAEEAAAARIQIATEEELAAQPETPSIAEGQAQDVVVPQAEPQLGEEG